MNAVKNVTDKLRDTVGSCLDAKGTHYNPSPSMHKSGRKDHMEQLTGIVHSVTLLSDKVWDQLIFFRFPGNLGFFGLLLLFIFLIMICGVLMGFANERCYMCDW